MITKKIPCPECGGIGNVHCFEEIAIDDGVVTCRAWNELCQTCSGTGAIEVPVTNADRINAMTVEEKRQVLIDYFSRWAGIGDSYIFDLTRVKTAFAIGTMGFDDFQEWDESRVEELVDDLFEWLQQPAEEIVL